jgi:uncharacterized protein (TIGR03437 family)
MDAVSAVFKKTVIVLSLALLAAMPRLAQGSTPYFVNPSSGNTITLVNGVASVNVEGSGDATQQPISFMVAVTYQSGDPHWLDIGNDISGTCTGGTNTYQTPVALNMGLGCNAGGLSLGNHTATVMLNPTSPSGVGAVTFYVQYNTNGNSGGVLVPSPSSLTGSNAMTAPVGGQVSTNVMLSTASGTAVTFTTSTGASWLTAQSNTNQVTNSAPVTLDVTANAAGLTATAYSSTVTVSYDSGQSLVINVTFNVTASAVSLTPSLLTWTYANSALSPAGPQTVTLTTPNSDNYTATVSYPSGATATNWLQVNNSGIANGLVNGSQLTISVVNYTNLAVGTYTGTITATDNGGTAGSGTLTVNLTVSGSSTGGVTISPNPVPLNSTNTYFQQVTVTSTNGGAFTATPSSTNNWLSVTLSQNSIVAGGTAYMYVTANTTLSGSGSFTGTITVSVGSVSQQVIVNLTAGSGAGGTTSGYVAPTTLNFIGVSGGAGVMQQVFFVGAGTFSISNSPIYSTNNGGVAWLNTSVIGGNMTTQGTPVTIYANPSKLAPGTYSATVDLALVTNGVAVTPPPTLTVNFVVVSGEVFVVEQPSSGTVILNGGQTSQNATITVTSSGSTALPVNVTTDQQWLGATVQSGATTTPANITVTANSSSLGSGLYAGNVIVTGGSSPALYVPVVLVSTGATSPTGLTVSSPSLTFAATLGGSPPAKQTLTVSSSTTGVSFTASASVTTPSGGTWLSITPSGSLQTSQGIQVSVNQSGLAAGTYSGDIVLAASGNTLTVPVSLVVGNGSTTGNVTVSASTLSFSAVAGGSAPATQTLTVSSASGAAGVSFTAAASSTGGWLSVSPTSATTQATLTVSVNQANLSGGNYSGSITITPAGGTAVVVQVGLSVVSQPSILVSPATLTFAFQAGSGGSVTPGQVTITASGGTANFQASASSTGNWLSVTPTSGSTSSTATLTVQVNPAGLAASTTPYTGTITITGASGTQGSATVNVLLNVTAPFPIISSVLNAASYANGAVSPGEIVSIFGTSIGPTNPSFLTLTSTGLVSTSIGNVTVSFSGYLAPLTYVSATQINCVVPYGLAGNKAPFAEVQFAGQKSNDYTLTLATSAPGIFTQNSSGSGAGAILNGDSTLNTEANPAPAGSTVQIFMTGEGLTTPTQATGTVTPVNTTGVGPLTPAPNLAVSVIIGNQPAGTTFIGEAPYFVAGVLQVNATIPTTASSGANAITVQIGKLVSQSNVTVWVK